MDGEIGRFAVSFNKCFLYSESHIDVFTALVCTNGRIFKPCGPIHEAYCGVRIYFNCKKINHIKHFIRAQSKTTRWIAVKDVFVQTEQFCMKINVLSKSNVPASSMEKYSLLKLKLHEIATTVLV